MIKVVNLVSLIIAPIIVQYSDRNIGVIVVTLALIGFLGWAIMRSKRASEPFAVAPAKSA
jgi:hypothetical protein